MHKLNLQYLESARTVINSFSEDNRSVIRAKLHDICEHNFQSVHVRLLYGPIKELKVRETRTIFCIENSTIYVLHAYSKKSRKTPKKELDISKRLYKMLSGGLNKLT